MILGELLFSHSTEVYSGIDPRPAKDATFSFNITQVSSSGSPSLTIKIYTKNVDEDSWGTAVGTISNITTTGIQSVAVTGLKEQVKVGYTMGGTNAWCRVLTYAPAF
jgi:hypothetical protein